MTNLTPGANTAVASDQLMVRVSASKAADVSSFRLYEGGKVRADDDMIFYGQKANGDQTVRLIKEGPVTEFDIDLRKLQASVEKIAFSITVDNGTVSALDSLSISLHWDNAEQVSGPVKIQGTETALILGELYKRNGAWKFRLICQGFNGGLQPLAEHFGVDIDEPEPTTSASIQAPSTDASQGSSSLNLSKITLDKKTPSINLSKPLTGNYGCVKINLNWDKGKNKGGFLGMGKKGIDLDLAAFVRLKDGSQGCIQAVGRSFGAYQGKPYVELQGDDRTGSSSGGEWIHINGDFWHEIDRILIYTYIYEGAPNWKDTNGKVTLNIVGQPDIETHLTEGASDLRTCAIAELSNIREEIKVQRLNRYFPSQIQMDEHYEWGFSWKKGSK